MPGMKEEDVQLDIYWQLAVGRVVVKDGVVFNVADKTVEGLWLDMKFAAKAFKVMNPLMIQKMELG